MSQLSWTCPPAYTQAYTPTYPKIIIIRDVIMVDTTYRQYDLIGIDGLRIK
jgi:hypothetical protein